MLNYKRLITFIILVTALFARLDWYPIHASYVQYGTFPHESVHTWWNKWSAFRYQLSWLCPPCAAFAEHYYFVYFEIEGGLDEQQDLLLKHIPEGAYEGVISQHGFWWGQGGEDNSNPWKRVSLLSWYLYWLPYTIIWWLVVRKVFYDAPSGTTPDSVRWMRKLSSWLHRHTHTNKSNHPGNGRLGSDNHVVR